MNSNVKGTTMDYAKIATGLEDSQDELLRLLRSSVARDYEFWPALLRSSLRQEALLAEIRDALVVAKPTARRG